MTRLNSSNVLVVTPAYNEERSIGSVIEAVREAGFHVVVVSDGSSDGTVDVCRRISAPVIQLPINLGVGGALRTGFQYACRRGYLAVVQVDADGQHHPALIHDLIRTANETGADLVLGSRFQAGTSTMRVNQLRRGVMKLLAATASVACHTKITDATSGFRLIRRPLLDHLGTHLPTNYLGDTYECLIMAGRTGYRVVEIPVSMSNRENGTSSASFFEAVKFTVKGIGTSLLRLHKRIDLK